MNLSLVAVNLKMKINRNNDYMKTDWFKERISQGLKKLYENGRKSKS